LCLSGFPNKTFILVSEQEKIEYQKSKNLISQFLTHEYSIAVCLATP
jgi:hypothetical protein